MYELKDNAQFLKDAKEFLMFTMAHMLDYTEQEACGTWPNIWCCDFWNLETVRCLMMGDKKYAEVGSWEYIYDVSYKSDVRTSAELKLNGLVKLEQYKDETDTLLIPECSRGIDILITNTIKKWKIITYDRNPLYCELAKRYWKDQIIDCKVSATHMYPFDEISEKCIIYANGMHYVEDLMKKINNPNFIKVICDGALLKG